MYLIYTKYIFNKLVNLKILLFNILIYTEYIFDKLVNLKTLLFNIF